MDYLSAKEVAILWSISERRVTKLCNERRVDGAIFKGNMWLIPSTTNKPGALKRGRKKENGEKKNG